MSIPLTLGVYFNNKAIKNGSPIPKISPTIPKASILVWRLTKVYNLLEQDQALYSFRHSGAIEIFKRTGSLTKLQKAMGHSSINVSLTYLRGLEVSELEVADMPKINLNY